MIHPVRLVVFRVRVNVKKSMADAAEDAAADGVDCSF